MATFPGARFPAQVRPYQRGGAQTPVGQAVGAVQEGIGAGQAIADMVAAYKDRGKRAEAHEITTRIMFGEASDQDVRRLPEVMPMGEAMQWKQTHDNLMKAKTEEERAAALERDKAADVSLLRFMLSVTQAPAGQRRQAYQSGIQAFQGEMAKTAEGQAKIGFLVPMMRSVLADGKIDDMENLYIMQITETHAGRIDQVLQQIGARADERRANRESDRRAARDAGLDQATDFAQHGYRSQEGGTEPLADIPRPGESPSEPAAPPIEPGNVSDYARKLREQLQRSRGR